MLININIIDEIIKYYKITIVIDTILYNHNNYYMINRENANLTSKLTVVNTI